MALSALAITAGEIASVILLAIPLAACSAVLYRTIKNESNPHAWRKR